MKDGKGEKVYVLVAPDETGTVRIGGRGYTLRGLDRSPAGLVTATWEGNCAACGSVFDFQARRVFKPVARCESCRKAGREALAARPAVRTTARKPPAPESDFVGELVPFKNLEYVPPRNDYYWRDKLYTKIPTNEIGRGGARVLKWRTDCHKCGQKFTFTTSGNLFTPRGVCQTCAGNGCGEYD